MARLVEDDSPYLGTAKAGSATPPYTEDFRRSIQRDLCVSSVISVFKIKSDLFTQNARHQLRENVS